MTVASLPLEDLNQARHERMVKMVCQRIAPSWPLDKLIAVNPFWGMKDLPYQQVSANLAAITEFNGVMNHQYWLKLYQQGQISDAALIQSLQHYDLPWTVEPPWGTV